MFSIVDSYGNYSFSQQAKMMDDYGTLKMQLMEVLEENALIKSRLHMELKERHILEAKNKDLSEKLIDAKTGLQQTGAALYKLQQATDQLMSKRDRRDEQLQRAMDQNKAYEVQIAELEAKLDETSEDAKLQYAINNYRKIIIEKDEIIRTLEDEQMQIQNQFAKSKRENSLLTEEKNDLQSLIETRQRKISHLESVLQNLKERNAVLEAEALQITTAASISTKEPISPFPVPVSTSKETTEYKEMESKMELYEKEKKSLEDRLQLLESLVSNSRRTTPTSGKKRTLRTPSPNTQKRNSAIETTQYFKRGSSPNRNRATRPALPSSENIALSPPSSPQVRSRFGTEDNTINEEAPKSETSIIPVRSPSLVPSAPASQPQRSIMSPVTHRSTITKEMVNVTANQLETNKSVAYTSENENTVAIPYGDETANQMEGDSTATVLVNGDEDKKYLIAKLLHEKKAIKRAIYAVVRDYEQKYKREPTKQEREILAKDFYKEYKQVIYSTTSSHKSCCIFCRMKCCPS